MNKLQMKMFYVYKAFKDICDRNNLRYYAAGGTKLGAILWQGIIPWDDDIDIAMPLDDLKKFIKIFEAKKPRGMAIFNGLEADHSDITCIKMFDTDTMFTSNNLINFPDSYTGVFIDIFPMIGLSKDKHEKEMSLKRIDELNIDIKRKKIFNLGGDIKPLMVEYNKIINKTPFDSAEYVTNIANPYKELFKRSEFIDTVDMRFGDSSIPVSKYYDKHLKIQYGSYTKDWPNSKKTENHTSFAFMNLNKSSYKYRRDIGSSPIYDYIKHIWNIKESLEREIIRIGEIADTEYSNNVKNIEQIDSLKLELEILKKENYKIVNSTSWKITKPMRMISKFLRAK